MGWRGGTFSTDVPVVASVFWGVISLLLVEDDESKRVGRVKTEILEAGEPLGS